MNEYFKKISNTDHISERKSKGLSDEVIKHPEFCSSIKLCL